MPQLEKMSLVFASCLLSACVVKLPGNLDVGDDNSTDEGDGDGDMSSSDEGDSATAEDSTTGDPPIEGDGCQDAVDILLIVDNSGSMGVLQRRFAESLNSLLLPLDNAGIDWRLGITTTDVDNLWCVPSGSERGALQLQSCKDHLDDFLFNNASTDVQDVACNDICPYAAGELVTSPTTTDNDPQPSPRPWIQRIGGVSNLPGNIDPLTAALCLVPQGINGCGFEQPLEAMALAVKRALTPGEPESGFIRDDASLLVVILSDEVDCSSSDDSIFDPNGNRVFWSDPNAPFPTSAVCWNAGVSCSGQAPNYDDCGSEDYDLIGLPTMPDKAVLHPVSRYTSLLGLLEQQKQELDPDADVRVLLIAGLGTDNLLHYDDVSQTDPQFQDSFGIGPGCVGEVDELTGEAPRAVPPVRMLETAVALNQGGAPIASICAPNYKALFLEASEQLIGTCE